MEVDQEDEPAPRSVLTDTPSSVSVSLHPLVVMNISDHFTRLRVQEEDSGRPPPGYVLNKAHRPCTDCLFLSSVYGALLGVQEGRSIEICNSFELLVTTISGNITHDVDYFVAKEKQCMLTLVRRRKERSLEGGLGREEWGREVREKGGGGGGE